VPETTHSLPIARLLVEVDPPGGGSWVELFDELRADPHEAAIIATLTGVVAAEGRFRAPVVVVDGELANGCHRLAAALAAGLDTIDVTYGYPAAGPAVEVELTVEVDPENYHDTADRLVGVLRSFPLDDETWVETDVIGFGGENVYGTWTCPPGRIDDLVNALAERLTAIGIAGRVRSAVAA